MKVNDCVHNIHCLSFLCFEKKDRICRHCQNIFHDSTMTSFFKAGECPDFGLIDLERGHRNRCASTRGRLSRIGRKRQLSPHKLSLQETATAQPRRVPSVPSFHSRAGFMMDKVMLFASYVEKYNGPETIKSSPFFELLKHYFVLLMQR